MMVVEDMSNLEVKVIILIVVTPINSYTLAISGKAVGIRSVSSRISDNVGRIIHDALLNTIEGSSSGFFINPCSLLLKSRKTKD